VRVAEFVWTEAEVSVSEASVFDRVPVRVPDVAAEEIVSEASVTVRVATAGVEST
jgi:hypothetical protein